MRRCRWRLCPKPIHQDILVQVYEFVDIPRNATRLRAIRIFFDLHEEDFYRVREYDSGREEWYKTNPHLDVEG
jgi:hypothetical protein